MKTLTAALAFAAISSLPAIAEPDQPDFAETGHPLIGEPPEPMPARAGTASTAVDTEATEPTSAERSDTKEVATSLLGLPVYDPDANQLGYVADILLGEDGAVEAIVIRAGGFLGIGGKDVAVPFADIGRATGPDGHAAIILTTINQSPMP